MRRNISAAATKESFRSRIIALLGGLALTGVLAFLTLGLTAPEASAHAPCSGGTHTHYHFFYGHSDYWHDHGTFWSGGHVYRSYHIHNHGDWRATQCT